jgi:glycosyltransferase involved in cell wall biosynthesis
MRVLLVSHRFPPDGLAGVERITQSLAAELLNEGDAVSIVTRRPLPPPSVPARVVERLPNGIRLFRFSGGAMSLDRPFLHHERLEALFTHALLSTKPDVVHFLHLVGLSPRLVPIARALGAPVVLELQDFYFACPVVHLRKRSGELCSGPDGGRECATTCFGGDGDPAALTRWGLRSAFFRGLLGMAQGIVCPSEYVASFFTRFGADPDRVHVLPNGIVLEPQASATDLPAPRQQGALNIAFVGTVVAHKGVHVIIEALRHARLPAVTLTVIGSVADQHYARSLRAQAAEIGGLRLRLYGEYEPGILPHLLRETDCVVTPSLVPEAGPITPREALACGVPVVSTRLGALPEIVIDGVNGMTFNHERPAELAAIFRRLNEDEALVHQLRQGARATDLPTIGTRASAIRRLYEKAIREADADAADTGLEGRLAEADVIHHALLESGLAGATTVAA